MSIYHLSLVAVDMADNPSGPYGDWNLCITLAQQNAAPRSIRTTDQYASPIALLHSS